MIAGVREKFLHRGQLSCMLFEEMDGQVITLNWFRCEVDFISCGFIAGCFQKFGRASNRVETSITSDDYCGALRIEGLLKIVKPRH